MPSPEITALLRRWSAGDSDAREAVWPELYPELRIIARSVLRGRRQGSVATTSLVHDAALRLLDLDLEWQSRRHFYALAAKTMRYELVDEARRRMAQKRAPEKEGDGELPEQVADPSSRGSEEILAVHQALERLAKLNARQERLVELRYFAGMSVDESAEILGISVPTVVRDWRAVRAWLRGQLQATV